jgi:hypothetical protein
MLKIENGLDLVWRVIMIPSYCLAFLSTLGILLKVH